MSEGSATPALLNSGDGPNVLMSELPVSPLPCGVYTVEGEGVSHVFVCPVL